MKSYISNYIEIHETAACKMITDVMNANIDLSIKQSMTLTRSQFKIAAKA